MDAGRTGDPTDTGDTLAAKNAGKTTIARVIEPEIRASIGKGKTIVIYGARQVGKTTLLRTIFGAERTNSKILWLSGDDVRDREMLSTASVEALRPLVERREVVIIDEAQRIGDIGLKLKILHDNFGGQTQFVATGSSSFDLANKINEPMTGRKRTFWLPAPSALELKDTFGYLTEAENLDNRLIYGSYPAVVTDLGDARTTITELSNDNLYKDVLNLGDIIKTDKLRLILKALALQIGSQVSMTEIAGLVGIDRKTVEKYISLLEQSFIIFRLPSFGRNLRNELKFSQKIYFYDTGIRNAIINDFRGVDSRPDAGAIFENYIIAELKKLHPTDNVYFWRTTDQQEVDFIIERDGGVYAYEVKLTKKAKLPNSFVEAYRPTKSVIVSRDNYLDVLTNGE
ncbi:ATP-binding protein [Candidatus Saccharibacteria bacterium]|nr:ATP-binding protein [Candidatus Saccharibacteria bacterium]